MSRAKEPMESWLREEFDFVTTDSAHLLYQRMESQSDYRLPAIYQPLEAKNPGHWHDLAICAAFTRAMEGAERILDVGPGDGWPSLRIASSFKEVVGIDPAPRRVMVQRENASRLGIDNVTFLEMNSMEMDFPDHSFDGVVAASSIEQAEDPGRAMAEIWRVLRPGAALAFFCEDFGQYFPRGGGDERVWVLKEEDGYLLYYQHREESTFREAIYALRIDDPQLPSPLRERLEDLSQSKPLPHCNRQYGRDFFLQLKPHLSACHCCEINHLTPEEIEASLLELGFTNIRHLDPFFCRLHELYQVAEREGLLVELEPCFKSLSRLLGIMEVEEARPGAGYFTLATRK